MSVGGANSISIGDTNITLVGSFLCKLVGLMAYQLMMPIVY